MDTNRREIILLAVGIFVLVGLMAVILWLGHRKRHEERKSSQSRSSTHTDGGTCLFKEVFAQHPDHNLPLITPKGTDSTAFIATVRRRSQTIAGAVQQELLDLQHNLTIEGLSTAYKSRLGKESGVALLAESKAEAETARHLPDTEANARNGSAARRRKSLLIRLDQRGARKSQEQPLIA